MPESSSSGGRLDRDGYSRQMDRYKSLINLAIGRTAA